MNNINKIFLVVFAVLLLNTAVFAQKEIPAWFDGPMPYAAGEEDPFKNQTPITEEELRSFIKNAGLLADLPQYSPVQAREISLERTGMDLTRFGYVFVKSSIAYMVLVENPTGESAEDLFDVMPPSLQPTAAEKKLIDKYQRSLKKALYEIQKDIES